MQAVIRIFSSHLQAPDGFVSELRSRMPQPPSLAPRVGFLMISIKNRYFTTKLIEAYCRFATQHFQAGYVTVVDRPYVHNVLASALDPQKVQKELEAIARIASERRESSKAHYLETRRESHSFVGMSSQSRHRNGLKLR